MIILISMLAFDVWKSIRAGMYPLATPGYGSKFILMSNISCQICVTNISLHLTSRKSQH